LQIGRFAAEAGAIVDDLAIDLASREVDETQTFASLGGPLTQRACSLTLGIYQCQLANPINFYTTAAATSNAMRHYASNVSAP